MGDYTDRNVIVTGGLGALGGALVDCLRARGATCFVPSMGSVGHDTYPPNVHVRGPIDLTDEPAVIEFFEDVPDLWASFHIAGGFAMGPIAETTVDMFRGLFDRNAVTAFLSSREAVRRMRQADGGGRIVNVIAKPVLTPAANVSAYAASKSAVAALTATLAVELAEEDILVNAVAPSIMDTPANRAAMPHADHSAWPSVDAVAHVMADLGSPHNTVVRGAFMPVYGRCG